MRTLVAGGAGFIGSHLCDRLVRDGADVICIDNLATGRMSNIAHLLGHPRFTFHRNDIVEPLPTLPRIDRIYHLASPASPPAYQEHPIETLRVNSEGTRNLLETALAHGSRFLFASTSEIYGDPLVHPQREDYRGNVSCTGARSMYDEAKRYGEAMTQAFAGNLGVETRIVRIFNTYGPRLDPGDGRVVSNLLVQAINHQPMTIYGSGVQTRSFQYVDDLVEGIVRLMDSSCNEPVNIGNPVEFTILDFAQLVRELTGTTSPVIFLPLPADDPQQRRPDISRARSLLDWEPKIPLAEGLRLTIDHYRNILPRHETSLAAGAHSFWLASPPPRTSPSVSHAPLTTDAP